MPHAYSILRNPHPRCQIAPHQSEIDVAHHHAAEGSSLAALSAGPASILPSACLFAWTNGTTHGRRAANFPFSNPTENPLFNPSATPAFCIAPHPMTTCERRETVEFVFTSVADEGVKAQTNSTNDCVI